MKKTLIPALIGLLACTLSASAITITINEDSFTRVDFTVHWGSGFESAPGVPIHSGGAVYFLDVTDWGAFLDVRLPFLGVAPFFDEFVVRFATQPSERDWARATLEGFDGAQSFAVAGDDFGARFVYGSPHPTAGVPDGGSTLMLLAGTLGTLVWFKRRRLGSV